MTYIELLSSPTPSPLKHFTGPCQRKKHFCGEFTVALKISDLKYLSAVKQVKIFTRCSCAWFKPNGLEEADALV